MTKTESAKQSIQQHVNSIYSRCLSRGIDYARQNACEYLLRVHDKLNDKTLRSYCLRLTHQYE